ncbi:MAG: hypothetical protein GX970_05995 [Phyllobacteriaceae bacterium]|nr:hypothetical protein [Phyllobacteriaceae bacterium]
MTHTQHDANPSQPQPIYYNGRALSTAETLSANTPPASLRRALPWLLAGWLGLLLNISDPLAGLLTLVAAPLLMMRLASQRHS